MSTADHRVASLVANDARDRNMAPPRKRESGMHPRFVLPAKHLMRVPEAQPRREVAAMNEVGELLRSASTPRDAFSRLVEVVESVVPVDAIAIASVKGGEQSLVWTSAKTALQKSNVAAAADAILGYFQTDVELEATLHEGALRDRRWVSLPVTDDDGAILGLFAMAPAEEIDEATVALAATIARHLAGVLARAEQMRHVFVAREHAELFARTSDRRVVEERRARIAAENTARSLRAASDATAVLLSTFDYRAALRHVARIVADQLGTGCVIDVEEELGLERVAHVPNVHDGVVATALAPLVVDVMRYRSAIATAKVSPNVPEGDARSRVVASQARRSLGADWIVSVPISTNGTSVLGALTVFGTAPARAPVPIAVVEELARRVATAIENGRMYLAAVEASQQREQVLSMVSHDLKNSFCVILMSVARVLEGMPVVERRQRGRSQLELIERSARRMLKLVADLLDVAAIDAGRISVTPRMCPLASTILEVFEDLSPQATDAGVALVCEVPEDLPPAQADAHRLAQILTNLIGNAIKFTADGGTVTANAEVTGANELTISIADTGVGIAPAHLEHVFDRFWQGPTGKAGSGLGLAICRGLVERSGGRIWAESTPGEGTTMRFTLPMSGAPAPTATKALPAEAPRMTP
jgi:signal transduction histidine kinase